MDWDALVGTRARREVERECDSAAKHNDRPTNAWVHRSQRTDGQRALVSSSYSLIYDDERADACRDGLDGLEGAFCHTERPLSDTFQLRFRAGRRQAAEEEGGGEQHWPSRHSAGERGRERGVC